MYYPFDVKDDKWSSCEMYDTNFTLKYNSSNVITNHTIISCKEWVYDKTEFQNTALMEVNITY